MSTMSDSTTARAQPHGRVKTVPDHPVKFSPRKFSEAMWDAGLNAQSLAEYMGCSPDAIGRWMAGIAAPRPGYAKGAAEIIGVDVSRFYED